ncbi:acid protease, partial [Aureobasidium sp. EXF-3399]
MVSLIRVLACLGLLSSCARAATTPNTIELALTSNFAKTIGERYYMNISIGTPGQVQTMAIDTGSSNTIVLGSNASFCETSVCAGGTLNLSAASTLETIDSGALQQSYVDHEYFEGDYFGDRVQMNDLAITNFPMGIANRMALFFAPYTGILGLGYSSHMAWPGTKSKKVALPPSFVEALVQAGSILFGGVDTAKYRGPLTTLNVVAEDEKPAGNFYLYLESVTMRPHGGQNRTIVRSTKHRRYRTVPDTGTPSWYLPTSAYRKVIKQAGVTSTDDVPLSSVFEHRKYVRPCRDVAYGTANTTRFDITFSGNGTNTGTLNLELANLFTPLTSEHGSVVTDGDGQPMCWLRVVESDELMITGSAVMRAGYFVFDLDNGQVSLAQANLGANSSNVVQVEAGTGLSKAASDVRSETKKINVEGQMSATAVYKLSTVTSNIDYGTGAKSHPAATGAVSQ